MKFEFQNPTRLIFGAGTLSRLGEVVRAHGKRALLVTGGGSVKRSGVFDRAISSLKAADVSVVECAGVEPNPRLSSVVRGARIARDEGCDVVIGLGGGSTMDAAKVMAAAVFYEGDPWEMMAHSQAKLRLPTCALPIVTVPTRAPADARSGNRRSAALGVVGAALCGRPEPGNHIWLPLYMPDVILHADLNKNVKGKNKCKSVNWEKAAWKFRLSDSAAWE